MGYRTKTGECVIITKGKAFPVHPNDPDWQKEMRRQANEREAVVRVKDGHELWGVTRADLITEEEWLAKKNLTKKRA